MSQYIKNIRLKEHRQLAYTPESNHDIKIAIYDLIEENYFVLLESKEIIFDVDFKLEENSLTLEIFSSGKEISLRSITVNVKKLLKHIREYIILCDSYYSAIKSAPVSKLEAIDVGRRSLHDLASEELIEKLKNYIDLDLNTARRFVTLISVLQRNSAVNYDSFYSD